MFVTDGTTKTQVVKMYGDTTRVYARQIQKPVAGTTRVLDGLEIFPERRYHHWDHHHQRQFDLELNLSTDRVTTSHAVDVDGWSDDHHRDPDRDSIPVTEIREIS
jgi:hypothetical protein